MRKVLILTLVVTLLVGCSNSERAKQLTLLENEVDTYKSENIELVNQIKDLEDQSRLMRDKTSSDQKEHDVLIMKFETTLRELDEKDEIIEELEMRLRGNFEKLWFDDMEAEAVRFIGEEYYNLAIKTVSFNEQELSEMSISNIHLGMTLDETERFLGPDYEVGGYYDEEINRFILTRTYNDGIKLFFDPLHLKRVYVTGEKYITDFNVNTGMTMMEAVKLYDNKYKRLKKYTNFGEGEVDRWIGTYLNEDESEVLEFRYDDYIYKDSELTDSIIIKEIILADYHPQYFFW